MSLEAEFETVESTEGVDASQSADGVVKSLSEDEAGEAEEVAGEVEAVTEAAGGQALRAVALALRQIGKKENPCGSNRNPYSHYFGFGGQFWCADFVAWCFDKTGNRDKKVPWGYPSAVRNITSWAQAHRLIARQPRRGDIFTYRNGAHTGLVTGVSGSVFSTVEGNTTGSDGTTCWVAGHQRRVGDGQYYYVRWPW